MADNSIPDIQQSEDFRGIPINQVGIKGLSYPIIVKDRINREQSTVANIEIGVSLAANQKGTHMSRFIEILNDHHNEIHLMKLPDILKQLKEKLETDEAYIKFNFPYFVRRKSPVTDNYSMSNYYVTFNGRITKDNQVYLEFGVSVCVASLCPCSKEISDYGAHNQRSKVDLKIEQYPNSPFIWIEELIDYVHDSCSSPVWSLLKRPDEKFVTETAYQNPMFVEDIVRSLAENLNGDARISRYKIYVTSYESIHDHNAFAHIRK